MDESQLTLDLHLVTCHKYCTDDDLKCDERCGFANMIILYFQDKSSFAENFPWHIPIVIYKNNYTTEKPCCNFTSIIILRNDEASE